MVQPDTREVGIGISELMALIGLPARLVGRLPLSPRYLWGGFHILNPGTSAYAEARWGKWYRLRVWLLPDIKELELLEELINRGSNRKIAAFRQSQLSLCGIIAITGALIAQMTITALQLPRLDQVHYTARGFFIGSLVMRFLGIYYACVQQRALGLATEPDALRTWISTGCECRDEQGNARLRSSPMAQIIIAAPFEFISIAVVLLLMGLGLYLGSAMTQHVALSPGPGSDAAIFITFVVVVAFPSMVFAHALGVKDLEEIKSRVGWGSYPMENTGMSQMRGERFKTTDSDYITNVETPLSPLDTERGRACRIRGKEDKNIELARVLWEASVAQQQCARANEKLARYYDCLSGGQLERRHSGSVYPSGVETV